jgi:opacity protein-like surface antigen
MNKKWTILSAALLALILAAFPAQALTIKFGGSLGYRTVSDSLIKGIYKSGGIQAGGFIGLGLGQRLELRVEAGTFKLDGMMTGSDEKLTLCLMPVTAGVRFQFLNKALRPYLGAGGAFVKYEEKYPERIGNVSDSASGFYAEGGIYLHAGRRLFFDANVRYLSAKADALDGKVDLGGIRAGLGFGLRF